MHLFLDMDGTVTESRSKIAPEMSEVLSRFTDVVIISGADKTQMRWQLEDLKCSIMSQNGNHNYLFQNYLEEQDIEQVRAHIEQFATILPDQLEDRGCQVSYSFVGHNAPAKDKKKFDPDGSHRQAILAAFPFNSKRLEVKIGGTTCFDYFLKGKTKGANIKKFIELKGWDARDCLYLGDALFPQGNDESVIGVIPTFPVKSPEETLTFLS